MNELPEETKRKINLSNTIYYVILVILFLYEASEFLTNFEKAVQLDSLESWAPFLLIVSAILSLILNLYGYWKVSRTLFLTSWIILVNVMPVLLYPISTGSYFAHPILCIVSSLMIHLFFSWYEDRWTYLLFLTVSFLLTASSHYFLSSFDSLQSYKQLPINFTQLLTTYLMCWVFINVTLVYVYRINWKAYVELHEKNDTIEHLNHDLEAKVEKRTKLLKEQNEKLREYAFINSHVLRAPVSRILGLVNLLIKADMPSTDKEIIYHLEESSKELDTIIRNLSVTLRESRDEKPAKN
jgi:signal transduction histidine kinase